MKTTVAVFFGGRSTEHEISVISANQAINALDRERYDVVPVYITKQGRWYTGPELLDLSAYRDFDALTRRCREVYMRPEYGDFNLYASEPRTRGFLGGKAENEVVARLDCAIPVLHGTNCEDGTFEGFLETVGLPFAGCDTLSSANGMDKITMKMILRECGLPVVDYVWFTDKEWHARRDELAAAIAKRLGYPVIVKPANLGSSVGIGAAANADELRERVADAARYASRIIVEHMVTDLREINCSVLGDADEYETSVCEEPVRSGEILSYEDKYMGGSRSAKGGCKGGCKGAPAGGAKSGGMSSLQRRVPADLPADVAAEVRRLAGETFRVLSCHGVARVDLMRDGADGALYVNEINTIPGSLSFYLWEATGLTFDKLMDRLVALAFKRKREKERKTVSYDHNIFAMGAMPAGGAKGAKS